VIRSRRARSLSRYLVDEDDLELVIDDDRLVFIFASAQSPSFRTHRAGPSMTHFVRVAVTLPVYPPALGGARRSSTFQGETRELSWIPRSGNLKRM
jgi:hypothetical protein